MSNGYGGNEIFHNTQRKVRLFNGQHRMANLPCMQEQNAGKNSQRHGAYKFPVVLSQVQAGKLGERKSTEYVNYQGARRIGRRANDAEPIICLNNYRLCVFSI